MTHHIPASYCGPARTSAGRGPIRSVLIARSAWGEMYEPAWTRALGELGLDARMFDTHRHFPPGLWGRIQQRVLCGPAVSRVNRLLADEVRSTRPDVTLLYQGHHFRPETIDELRRYTFVVGYHNDDLLGQRKHMLRYRHLKRALPHYHGYHVYRHATFRDLAGAGVDRGGVLMSYYLPWLDYPRRLDPAERRRFQCDVAFAGHFEDDGRVECLGAAARAGLHVRVYGAARWWRPALSGNLGQAIDLQPAVYSDDYRKALCGAKIAACFLSKWNRDQYTRRVFEVPACGVFLLAERTPVMGELYAEGKEAEFFASPEEFLSKAQFYLAHPSLRKRIAEAGHRRATRSGYDIHSRMQEWLRDIHTWRDEEQTVPHRPGSRRNNRAKVIA